MIKGKREFGKIIPLKKEINEQEYHVGFVTYQHHSSVQYKKINLLKQQSLFPPVVYIIQSGKNNLEKSQKIIHQAQSKNTNINTNYDLPFFNQICKIYFKKFQVQIQHIIMPKIQMFLRWQKAYKNCCQIDEKFWNWVYQIKKQMQLWNIWLQWMFCFEQFRASLFLWAVSFQQLINEQDKDKCEYEKCFQFFNFIKKYIFLKRKYKKQKNINTVLEQLRNRIGKKLNYLPQNYLNDKNSEQNDHEQQKPNVPYYFNKFETKIINGQHFQIFKVEKIQSIYKLQSFLI